MNLAKMIAQEKENAIKESATVTKVSPETTALLECVLETAPETANAIREYACVIQVLPGSYVKKPK